MIIILGELYVLVSNFLQLRFIIKKKEIKYDSLNDKCLEIIFKIGLILTKYRTFSK